MKRDAAVYLMFSNLYPVPSLTFLFSKKCTPHDITSAPNADECIRCNRVHRPSTLLSTLAIIEPPPVVKGYPYKSLASSPRMYTRDTHSRDVKVSPRLRGYRARSRRWPRKYRRPWATLRGKYSCGALITTNYH